VSYGEPIPAATDADRKTVTKRLEGAVRQLTVATLLGRPRPVRLSTS